MSGRIESRLQALEAAQLEVSQAVHKPDIKRTFKNACAELDEWARLDDIENARLRAELGEAAYAAHRVEQERLQKIQDDELRKIEIKPEWMEWGFDSSQLTIDQICAVMLRSQDDQDRERAQIAEWDKKYGWSRH